MATAIVFVYILNMVSAAFAQEVYFLTRDFRGIETNHRDPISAGYQVDFDQSLDVPYINKLSGKQLAVQHADQNSFFTDNEIKGDGNASVDWDPDHAGSGAFAKSNLDISFSVLDPVIVHFSASSVGNEVSDNVQLGGGNLGVIAHVHRTEDAQVVAILSPGEYHLTAHAVATASKQDKGSWHFDLKFGPQGHLEVSPYPFDFGHIIPRKNKRLIVQLINDGDSGSVVRGKIRPSNSPYFTLASTRNDFEIQAGDPALEISIDAKVGADSLLYASEITGQIVIETEGTQGELMIPLKAFVDAPEIIHFQKVGTCLNSATDVIEAQLSWESTTGVYSDLFDVTIREVLLPTEGWLTGPANCDCLIAPPPWVVTVPAGETEKSHWKADKRRLSLCATAPPGFGAGLDTHGVYDWEYPLVEGEFRVRQTYQWTSPWKPGWTDLLHDTINRRIYKNLGLWYYEVTSLYAGSAYKILGPGFLGHFVLEEKGTSKSAGFQLFGEPEHVYDIQRAATIAGPWLTLGTYSAPTNGLIQFKDTNPPPAGAFYRAQEQ